MRSLLNFDFKISLPAIFTSRDNQSSLVTFTSFDLASVRGETGGCLNALMGISQDLLGNYPGLSTD